MYYSLKDKDWTSVEAFKPGNQGIPEGFTGQRIQVIPAPLADKTLKRPFTRNLFASAAGFFPNADSHMRKRSVGTDELIVLLCTQGAGWVQIGEQAHQVLPGQLAIIAPHAPHSYGSTRTEPWSIWWCHLRGTTLSESLSYFPGLDTSPVQTLRRPERIQSRLQELLECMEKDPGQLLLEINAGAATHLMGDLIADQKHPERGEPLERAMAYLQQNIEKTIAVPEVAKIVGLSTSHLTTLFRNATGSGVLAYHTSLKMERARQLLDTTSMPIVQIAKTIGYSDQFYFSRHFKASHGTSPSTFRTRNTKEDN